MTKDFQSPSSQECAQDDPAPELGEEPQDDRVKTLTDLFDQLDRAAFKRALAHRDVEQSAERSPKAGSGG